MTADLFTEEPPPSPSEASQAADNTVQATQTPANRFARLVRLPGGSQVLSDSEAWREACEVSNLCGLDYPDTEIVRRAEARSGKDPEVAKRLARRLRRLVSLELARRPEALRKLEPAAAVILALPTREARQARLAEIEAADGILARQDMERAILALWRRQKD